MPVQAADCGVAEQHRAAAVRLQAVLVRVDHHRVALGDSAPGRRVEPGTAAGVTAIGAAAGTAAIAGTAITMAARTAVVTAAIPIVIAGAVTGTALGAGQQGEEAALSRVDVPA